jgi:hypothetical protein
MMLIVAIARALGIFPIRRHHLRQGGARQPAGILAMLAS